MLSKYYFNNSSINKFTTIKSIDASDFTKYDLPKKGNTIAVFCSQSGETYDIIKAINICKEYNYFMIGIVNVVDSYISKIVNCGIYINCGKEYAVASTKSFTSTLIILSLFGMWFKDKYKNIKYINELRCLPNNIKDLLNNFSIKNDIIKLAKFIVNNDINNIFILGVGKLYPIAKEIALKIKEICYIHAEGFSGLSLKHGPFALLDNANLSILLIDKKNKDILNSTYNEIIGRKNNCYIFTDTELENIDENIIFLPLLDHYQEIIFTVALQYLSYEISIKKI